ncbi:16S rRNA (cytosine1402-N4)-methyltransferase [Desulfosoma caldarium]|uniref:Ribosomal RNA small subunit methyltransferase H n=2 Tax=Desulfosoma caldarium TaxID=610254 RepID=A0A3N1V123_9BACT|nr:16S rRNA (cytosine1402-N4)-methyltransferase [Desulfosoma caldarium]
MNGPSAMERRCAPQSRHVPVLLKEAVGFLRCRAGGRYVDATVGGGGYAEAILEASAPDGLLLGLDWDQAAVDRVRSRLAPYGPRVFLVWASFDGLSDVLQWHGWSSVDGIVADLGVSSDQLDDPRRGLSFLEDGPLDMRMNRAQGVTAAQLVNTMPEEELAWLIRSLGEERFARRIAAAICARRRIRPFTTTTDLAQVVAAAVPKSADTRRLHPATRTFLALRLAVNRELEVLERFLGSALQWLKPEGRLVVVSFHSLEDRIVKRCFQSWAASCRCPRDVPVCRCEGRPLAKVLTRKPVRPQAEEVARNPRARSARLRVVEKLS